MSLLISEISYQRNLGAGLDTRNNIYPKADILRSRYDTNWMKYTTVKTFFLRLYMAFYVTKLDLVAPN